MKIILISGKAESGKDTFANLLEKELMDKNKTVIITHHGDLVKYLASKYFNWSGDKDEEGRKILQYIGTEKVRSKNPDFWVNFLIDFSLVFEDDFDYMLVPDTRFPNEIERWKQSNLFDIFSLRIERPNHESKLTSEQKLHESEIALDNYKNFDRIITNDKTLNDLKKEVGKIVNEII